MHAQLREMQLRGADPAGALTRATERDMTGARSIAGVIHSRVTKLGEQDGENMPAHIPAASWSATTPGIEDPPLPVAGARFTVTRLQW